MPYTGTLDAAKPTVFPHGIQAVVVGSGGSQATAIVSLTDNSGGTANDTIAAVGGIVTLTDSTGLSGTHNDTLAAVTTFTPSVAWDGATVFPSAADATAIGTAITVLNQNSSDTAQKVIELVADSTAARSNTADLAAKVNAILAALRTAGIIAT